MAMDLRPLKAYIILIAAWVLLYAAFDAFYPPGSDYIAFTTAFFFTESAVIFGLSLMIGGELARKGKGLKDTAVDWLGFFAAFVVIGLVASLVSTAIRSPTEMAYAAVVFLVLAVAKLFIGLVGLLAGFYLSKSLDRNIMLAASVVIILIVGVVSYLAGRGIAQSINFTSSPGYSDSLAKCAVGEWGYADFFGASLNTTVQGITTYRGRQACHASGSGLVYGVQMTFDSYKVDAGDYCTVTVTSSNESGTTTRERCYGDWPGYVPSSGG